MPRVAREAVAHDHHDVVVRLRGVNELYQRDQSAVIYQKVAAEALACEVDRFFRFMVGLEFRMMVGVRARAGARVRFV